MNIINVSASKSTQVGITRIIELRIFVIECPVFITIHIEIEYSILNNILIAMLISARTMIIICL